MTSTTPKPIVVRLSKQQLLKQRASVHDESIAHVFVQTRKKRSESIHINKKNTVEPVNDTYVHNSTIIQSENYDQPISSHSNASANIYRPSASGEQSITSIKLKDTDLSVTYNRLKSVSSKNSFLLGQTTTLGNTYEKQKKQKKRRRCLWFKVTPCCCCCLLASILALILLAAMIAAIILLAIRANTTTTTTTTTTVTTSTTSTTSTSSTSTTTTSTTTTSSTTTSCNSCGTYCWNQTGVAVADTSSNTLSDPRCLTIDENDTFYICSHNLGYVETWTINATSRTAATNPYNDHIDSVIFDKDGYMYTNDHNSNRVRRYPPNSLNDSIIVGTGSTVTGTLGHPTGLAIDDDFNLYIADQNNDRIAKWAQNSSNVVTAINTAGTVTKPSFLLFAPGVWDQIYISDEGGDSVFLWKFNSTSPSIIYTNVDDNTTLKKPRGIKLDQNNNLYVADYDKSRVVMYCANSTIGTVIATVSGKAVDIAFDSHMNLYVVVDTGKIYKYALL